MNHILKHLHWALPAMSLFSSCSKSPEDQIKQYAHDCYACEVEEMKLSNAVAEKVLAQATGLNPVTSEALGKLYANEAQMVGLESEGCRRKYEHLVDSVAHADPEHRLSREPYSAEWQKMLQEKPAPKTFINPKITAEYRGLLLLANSHELDWMGMQMGVNFDSLTVEIKRKYNLASE